MIPVYLDEKGVYTFNLPRDNMYNLHYRVNGEPVSFGTYTSETKPVIEKWSKDHKKVKMLSEDVNYPDLSIEEYENKKKELESKGEYIEDYGNMSFENVEDEIEYIRFKRTYRNFKYAYEYSLYETVPVEVKKVTNTNNPYITLFRHLGGSYLSTKGTYDRRKAIISKLESELLKHGFESSESAFGKPLKKYKIYDFSNSGEIIVYIEGRSVMKEYIKSVSDEIDVLEKMYEEDMKRMGQIVNEYILNSSKLPNVQEVIGKLNSIYDKVQSIDVKVKSKDDKSAALRWIKDLINDLQRG